MIRVCPNASLWVNIYQRLDEAWKKLGSSESPPPMPLVLAGWVYSSDCDKQQRWKETLEWASRHSLSELIPNLSDSDYYTTDWLSTSYPEQHYRSDRYAVRTRPSQAAIKRALEVLKRDWNLIAGEELGGVCEPHSLTGAKARRLLVTVFREASPPWGTWFSLSPKPKRETFTSFRKRINQTIAPDVYVDHVDFELRYRV
jgi:hypothetical protein